MLWIPPLGNGDDSMSLGTKQISDHEVQTTKDLTEFTRPEVHTCTKCGLKFNNLQDLIDSDCNH